MANVDGDGSSLVTSFCISLALLRRMEARSFEKEPLRRVRPTHLIYVLVWFYKFVFCFLKVFIYPGMSFKEKNDGRPTKRKTDRGVKQKQNKETKRTPLHGNHEKATLIYTHGVFRLCQRSNPIKKM